jgi:hypothetical protein
MFLSRCRRWVLGLPLFLIPIAVACSASTSNPFQTVQTGAPDGHALGTTRLTDSTIIKSGPFASSYEVRGPRKGYFFPPKAIITASATNLFVRAYGKVWVYALSGVKVRRLSSLSWFDGRHFPAERTYRDSVGSGTPAVLWKICPDCKAVVPEQIHASPADTSGPFPVPPEPTATPDCNTISPSCGPSCTLEQGCSVLPAASSPPEPGATADPDKIGGHATSYLWYYYLATTYLHSHNWPYVCVYLWDATYEDVLGDISTGEGIEENKNGKGTWYVPGSYTDLSTMEAWQWNLIEGPPQCGGVNHYAGDAWGNGAQTVY